MNTHDQDPLPLLTAPLIVSSGDPVCDPIVHTYIAKSFKLNYNESSKDLKVECTQKTPMDSVLIAVLDTSGSMGEQATNSSNTGIEGLNFTRMDLLKHSMKTVSEMLHSRDNTSLGIIGFDSSARLLMPTQPMKLSGLSAAHTAIDSLYPGGATNIWDGLRLALQEANKSSQTNPNANIHIILLTDGEPTDSLNPPNGILKTLQSSLGSLNTPLTLSTFGFGYNLDSMLLHNICKEGNGTYGYIPDCSMVATVFINYCSSLLSTVVSNVKVGSQYVGNLQAGHSKSIWLETYESTLPVTYDSGQMIVAEVVKDTTEKNYDLAALRLVQEKIEDYIYTKNPGTDAGSAEVVWNPILHILKNYTQTEMIKALMEDIQDPDPNSGQITKAIESMNWWKKWGLNHYISYSRSLKVQECVNFKDKAIQYFSSSLFQQIQEAGNVLYANIPAPIPRGYTRASLQATGFSMATFNADDSGCFMGNCLVKMYDGMLKPVSEIRKGDILKEGFQVQCVIRRHPNKMCKMVKFPQGLTITPWHPVRAAENTNWKFPCMWMQQIKMMYVDTFYDFVLDHGHYAIINGLHAVTLGHGWQGEIIGHDYFGTEKIIMDLKEMNGWDNGLIDIY